MLYTTLLINDLIMCYIMLFMIYAISTDLCYFDTSTTEDYLAENLRLIVISKDVSVM